MAASDEDDEEDGDDDVDLTLRHVSQKLPLALARAFSRTRAPIESATWSETQLTSRQRRLDRALLVKAGSKERLLHVEWSLVMSRDLPWRVFEYHVMTAMALRDEARAKAARKLPRIESVVVLLSGRDEPWPEEGEYRTSSEETGFSGVRFRIEPVYQRTVAELERRAAESASPLWTLFTPLARDADPAKMRRILDRLREDSSEESFEEMGVAMAVLARLNRRDTTLRRVIRSCLPRVLVMKNWNYREGREEGRKLGHIEVAASLIERRLGRTLSAEECDRLALRIGKRENRLRLVDALLDLSTPDLEVWLAAPVDG